MAITIEEILLESNEEIVDPFKQNEAVTDNLISIEDIDTIFVQNQKQITNLIYRIIHNRDQAMDLTQDVFLKLYKALVNDIKIPKKAFHCWLNRVAINTATDAYRHLRLIVWQSLNDIEEERNDDEEKTVGIYKSLSEYYGYHSVRFENTIAERDVIERVLQQMAEKDIVCLWLFENDGFALPEIAEMLEISYAAAKMRLMRSRNRFIQLYQKEVSVSI